MARKVRTVEVTEQHALLGTYHCPVWNMRDLEKTNSWSRNIATSGVAKPFNANSI